MSSVPCSFFTLRAVPHPHTGDGVPVAVVLQSRPAEFLGIRAITEPGTLAALVPEADVELLARYLRSCEAIAAGDDDGGDIALLSRPERFHWLAAPRSDVLQPSPVEYRAAEDPAALLDQLFAARVDHG
jgi:hypothetical protein